MRVSSDTFRILLESFIASAVSCNAHGFQSSFSSLLFLFLYPLGYVSVSICYQLVCAFHFVYLKPNDESINKKKERKKQKSDEGGPIIICATNVISNAKVPGTKRTNQENQHNNNKNQFNFASFINKNDETIKYKF